MEEKRGRGRPKLFEHIRPEAVFQLAKILPMTDEAIAAALGMSEKSLKRYFAPELSKGRAEGRKYLSALQWKSAGNGNVTMQIWLGKNYLNQSDKVEQKDEHSGEIKLAYKL